ncbi:MAG: hypothetical protein CMD72_03970 [Gammaproteobacteria bacterium]|nr:hypothetical protein [Gammaproteobacteria bacterium]|tara:strand:- start:71 stop:1042 length:972 start_codon:yes stop_codon:yes gene_type:complete
MNIAIIGCGNIGFRHLESILNINEFKTVYIVDSSKQSLIRCQNLASSINSSYNNINYYSSIKELNSNISLDIAIIASNSSVRAALIKELYSKITPKHLILEKLLFTKISDLTYFLNFFKEYKSKVWVNQWLDSEVKYLSNLIPKNEKFNLTISGSQWGLCCNSVHFIEWFHAMSLRKKIKITGYNFKNIIEAKRSGYYEIIGSIKASSNTGNTLLLDSDGQNNPDESINIDLLSPSIKISCIWTDDRLIGHYVDQEGTKKQLKEKIEYQSQRTHKVILELINSNKCNLPSYKTSYEQHLLFYPLFNEYFKENGFNTQNGIPIT